MKPRIIHLIAALITLSSLIGLAAGGMPLLTSNLEWQGRIVVEFSERLGAIQVKAGSDVAQLGEPTLDALAQQFRVYHIEKLIPGAEKPPDPAVRDISRYYILEFPAEVDLHTVANIYQQNPYIVTAEPYLVRTCLYTPNDPLLAEQWALDKVNAETAFDYCRGSEDVIVGIVDMGIDTAHVDLRDNLWVNPGEDLNHNGIIELLEWNGYDDDQNGYIDDFWGWNTYQNNNNVQESDNSSHGIACAGAASAVTDNDIGIASLGYCTKIMTVRAGDNGYIYNAMQGVQYCVGNGANVLSLSFGSYFYSAYEQSVITNAWNQGVAIFAAAGGGSGTTPMYPAAYNNVVGVGSTDENDHLASFTSYGPWVDLYAPGVNLLVLIHNNAYTYMSGTSFSCPMAAGLACLVWAADTSLTNTALIQQILTTAADIDSLNTWTSGLLRIDAGAAVSGLFLNVNLMPINPPIIIPPGGGSFSYTIEVANQDSSAHPIDFWSDVVLPNGLHYGPISGPLNRTLLGNSSISRQRAQIVPANAPPGNYLLIAYLGGYPTSICARDTIPFAKLGSGSCGVKPPLCGGLVVGGWANMGEDFDEAEKPLITHNSSLITSINPNPFNPTTVLSYELRVSSLVSLRIYDTGGRLVAALVNGWQEVGEHRATFDATGMPSGIYLVRLAGGNYSAVQKMVLLK